MLGQIVVMLLATGAPDTKPSSTTEIALAKADEFMLFAAFPNALQVIVDARSTAETPEDVARLAYGEGVVRSALGELTVAFECFVVAETNAPGATYERPASKRSTDRLHRCARAFVRAGGDLSGARAVLERSVGGAEDVDAELRRQNEQTETWACPRDLSTDALVRTSLPPPPSVPSEPQDTPAWPWLLGGGVLVVVSVVAVGLAATSERAPFGGSTGVITMPSDP